jgi:hypothetical protein
MATEDGPPWFGLDPEVLPNLDELVTEDGAPVERIYTEKQYRLLTEPLYTSWPGPGEGRTFLVLANVGYFHTWRQPPVVPDTLLSLDAVPAGELRTKEGHSYFQWLIGKPPDVLIEIVSDRRGGEEDFKMKMYARLRVLFYVIYDPENILGGGVLRAHVLQRSKYEPVEPGWFPEVGLGLTLWEGVFEGVQATWLRWCDQQGRVIQTGAERAEEEHRRAEEEHRRGEEEGRRAEEEHRRAEEEGRRADQAAEKIQRLAAQLRALGIEPEA